MGIGAIQRIEYREYNPIEWGVPCYNFRVDFEGNYPIEVVTIGYRLYLDEYNNPFLTKSYHSAVNGSSLYHIDIETLMEHIPTIEFLEQVLRGSKLAVILREKGLKKIL